MIQQVLVAVLVLNCVSAQHGWGFPPRVTPAPESDVQLRQRLLKTLLDGYDRRLAPNPNTVNVSLLLNRVDADVWRNEVHSDVFIIQNWFDDRLSWDPLQFGGIERIYVPEKTIWTVDMSLYNSKIPILDAGFCADLPILIESNGKVSVEEKPCSLISFCKFNLTGTEAVDPQTCLLTLGSWVLPAAQMDIHFNSPIWGIASFNDITDWSLSSTGGYRSTITGGCCPAGSIYPVLNFSLVIQKKQPVISIPAPPKTSKPKPRPSKTYYN